MVMAGKETRVHTIQKTGAWQEKVTNALLSQQIAPGDVLEVQDYEMAQHACNLICRRALGVVVRVQTPSVEVLVTWYGQDSDEWD